MQFLFLFIFFGIIFAQEDEAYQELTKRVDHLSAKLDRFDDNQGLILKIMVGMQTEIDELKTSLASQDSRIQANEESIAESIANIGKNDDLRIEIDELRNSLASQESRIQTNEQSIAENNANIENIDDMRIQIDELDSLLASQESRIQANEQSISESNANVVNIDDFQIQIDELKSSVTNQETRIQTNEEYILESKENIGKIDELESRLTSQESRIQVNEESILESMTNIVSIDDLRLEIGEFQSSLTSQESRIQTNEADILENKESIGNVEDFQNDIASVSSFNDLVKFTAIVSMSHASKSIGANEIITFLEADKCRTTCEIPAVQNNILSSMDPLTGVFKVPFPATYSFYFAGAVSCDGQIGQLAKGVELRVHQIDGIETKTNSIFYGWCDTSNGLDWNGYYPVRYEWTMTLNQGDQIYLKLPQNRLMYMYEFHGQLAGNDFEHVFDQSFGFDTDDFFIYDI